VPTFYNKIEGRLKKEYKAIELRWAYSMEFLRFEYQFPETKLMEKTWGSIADGRGTMLLCYAFPLTKFISKGVHSKNDNKRVVGLVVEGCEWEFVVITGVPGASCGFKNMFFTLV